MPATPNLEEIDQFLEIYNKAKMKKEEIRNLNTQITGREIESAIKNLHTGDAYINRIEWKAETRYKPVTLWSIKRQQGRKEYPKHKDRLFNKP